jgi:hypothetical protein
MGSVDLQSSMSLSCAHNNLLTVHIDEGAASVAI